MSAEPAARQLNALFNILSHHEAYQELQDLRIPGALAQSGPPFKTTGEKNESPLFQHLLLKCIVPLPGLRDVDSAFWQDKCQQLIEDFAKKDLSESYEAGYIGIRKTLATAAAATVEGPARGIYGGFPAKELERADGKYDTSNADDVVLAWKDFLQGIVYGELIDELFAKCAETDNIEDHSSMVQAAHEYMLVMAASFMHYILVMSPEGPTLFSLMKTANSLVPYLAIRQALKIGNVASMISAMMRIILAKISLNTVTTFIGLTNASDAGMNLLQTIISTVVNWDTNTLKSKSADIAKKSKGLQKQHRETLDKFINASREEREKCRIMSKAKSEPIAVTIIEEYGSEPLVEEQIPLALEYLSLEISVQDRQKICDVLCSRQPDLLTQAVREAVAAYDPVIRDLHKAVDLSGTFGDLGDFLTDLFKLPISSTKDKKPPTVEDFVALLHKHQKSVHKFIHQICKNGPELSEWYSEYAKAVAQEFRNRSGQSGKDDSADGGAGRLSSSLSSALSKLSEKQQRDILSECDAHAEYLQKLSALSESRMKNAITYTAPSKGGTGSKTKDSNNTSGAGPGMFLKRWQAYINETVITSNSIDSPLRHGGDESVVDAGRSNSDGIAGKVRVAAAKSEDAKPPKCHRTVELLASQFRNMLRELNEANS